jgi:hypothetical protein
MIKKKKNMIKRHYDIDARGGFTSTVISINKTMQGEKSRGKSRIG